MPRKIHYGRKPCPRCGDLITKNALGRAAHLRHCTGGKPGSADDAALRRRYSGTTASRDPR